MSAERLCRLLVMVALGFASCPAAQARSAADASTLPEPTMAPAPPAPTASAPGFVNDNGHPVPRIDSPDFPYLLADPLHARPGILATGTTLPGDDAPFACPSQVDLPKAVGLGEAVDLALCRSPQVQAAWAAIKIQAAALGEARAASLPTVSATLNRLHNRTVYPGLSEGDTKSTGQTGYGAVSWRLFDFGARGANAEAVTRQLAAALATHDAVLQKTLSGVVEAYFDALTAQAARNERAQASRIADQTLEATRRREARSAAPLGDTLQARAALARARLAEQRAGGDFRKALSVLLYAIGLPVDTDLHLVEEDDTPIDPAVGQLDRWLEEAQYRHPAIVAARAQWQAAQARVEATRAQGLPTLDITGNYYRNGYPNQGLQANRSSTTTIGLSLTIPLFEGLARTYQVRGAQAQAEHSEAQFRDTELQVLTAIVKDHADASSGLENLAASATWLSASQEAVASAQRRYDKGAADVLELLAAQSALSDARQERVRCIAEWRSARLRLLADAGKLGRAAIGVDR